MSNMICVCGYVKSQGKFKQEFISNILTKTIFIAKAILKLKFFHGTDKTVVKCVVFTESFE